MSTDINIPESALIVPDSRPVHWNLHRLRLFLTVARLGSYTAAARELSIAQPAVSHQVKALEGELGVHLFDRRGRGIELTSAGHALLETCNDVFHSLDEGARALAELSVGARGTVDIAADTTSGIYVVPAALGSFHRSHPGIDVTLHVENRDGVLRRLTERTCDLAVMADPPSAIGVEVAPFVLDRLVAIAAPDHPLGGQGSITLGTLTEERFLLREVGSGTRAATERLFARAGLRLEPAMELGSTGAIKQAVAAGLGISVVSRWAIDLELQVGRLALLDVVGLPIERRWSIVNLEARRLTAAAGVCRAFLEAHAASGS
jgi:LysR family transcriptional regulator, low CO2-responsive transcriptional regulator